MSKGIRDFLRDEERALAILANGALAIMVVGLVGALAATLLLK